MKKKESEKEEERALYRLSDANVSLVATIAYLKAEGEKEEIIADFEAAREKVGEAIDCIASYIE